MAFQVSQETIDYIDNIVKTNEVALFIKGKKEMPMCGFSGAVVKILNNLHVDYACVNILDSEELRQGIKDYGNWPTVPQLYVRGELIGGCDIVRELHQSGELMKILMISE